MSSSSKFLSADFPDVLKTQRKYMEDDYNILRRCPKAAAGGYDHAKLDEINRIEYRPLLRSDDYEFGVDEDEDDEEVFLTEGGRR